LHSVDDASAATYASGGAALLAFGGHGNASISSGRFVHNTAGRVIVVQGNASLLVNASEFSSNEVSGSCIYAVGASSVTVHNTAFANTTAYSTELTDGGAALYITGNATVDMASCSVVNNTAADTVFGGDPNKSGRWGGGIRMRGYSKLTMRSCALTRNTAYLGGALFAGGDAQVGG
jgi:hypothetical protein